jgi:N-acetylneuraminic acid mutarotase
MSLVAASLAQAADPRQWLDWQPLPPLPAAVGVAGPFVGTHRGALVVAGGANFAAADAAEAGDYKPP